MKRTELAQHDRVRPQKLSGRETPHVTIEPNTTCNIRCAYCYCIEEAAIKTFDEVRADIDLAISLRNLDAVSLLGGEPTLHPDIVEIVRYVKSKGLVCMLLTNGVAYLRDHDEALFERLIAAGVDRFLVHIDSGQKHVHGDIEAARHRMFDMLDRKHVSYGLSLTLYRGQEHELPRALRELARHPWFDGVLCTLAFDLDHAFDRDASGVSPRPAMSDVYRAMRDDLHVEPATYLPSSTDDDEIAWLMYFYFTSARTGATFAISPELNRATKALFRAAKGHHFFAETMKPGAVAPSLAAAAVADVAMHPSRARELAKLLRNPKDLRFHYAVVQEAPSFDAAHGKVRICWQCPDATIRNGQLVPVCIAGRVSPLSAGRPTAPPDVIETIRKHLAG